MDGVMKRVLASVALLTAVGSLAAAAPQPSVAPFRLTLERSATGWQAQCDAGCHWTTLAVTCPGDCRVLIDASGVAVNPTGEKTSSAFGFVVSRSQNGWRATSITGTAWSSVEWHCGPPTCGARIDEAGVTTLVIGRTE
jgi:hypothetical protein